MKFVISFLLLLLPLHVHAKGGNCKNECEHARKDDYYKSCKDENCGTKCADKTPPQSADECSCPSGCQECFDDVYSACGGCDQDDYDFDNEDGVKVIKVDAESYGCSWGERRVSTVLGGGGNITLIQKLLFGSTVLLMGRLFDPVGWDLVRSESINKAEKLMITSQNLLNTWQRNRGNWGWFNSKINGFRDPYDVYARNSVRFPQRPHDYPLRAAGVKPSDEVLRLIERTEKTGRSGFLDRGPMLKPSGHSMSTPCLMRRLA